jgi:prepilin-type N-terminal cleavage/methylation domain-containing protein
MRNRCVDHSGFTLLETLIAILLLTAAATTVARVVSLAVGAHASARARTGATLLAAQKLEQLRALAFGCTEGAPDRPGWPLTDVTTDLSVDPPGGGGSGLAPGPPGSIDRSAPGYADYLDEAGRWLGTGSTPAESTTYVRRWSVDALPDDPAHARVLRVEVATLRSELQRGARAARPHDSVRLATIRVRSCR